MSNKITKLKTKEVRELLSQPTPEDTQVKVEEKIAVVTAEEKAKAEKDAGLKNFINAMAIVAGSDAGVVVLRELSALCGWEEISAVTGPTGDFAPHATVYNEGRRSIWQKFRLYLPFDKRIIIENPPPAQAPVETISVPAKPNA